MTETIPEVYRELVSRLSLHQKVRLLTGASEFALYGEPAIGLVPMNFSDGPTGVRGAGFTNQTASSLLPNATVISGSWDDEIAAEVGEILAAEAERKHVHVVLGPTINLHRSPLGGRLFEAYSEDPLLTGRTAVAYVRAMQARAIGACLKHLVGNESETMRNFESSEIDEKTLRETYLLPFEMAVDDAHAWTMMCGYNDVNGTRASEHDEIQNQIVKGEWGWDGVIMSDWYAAKTTGPAIEGGLDLVMPGPDGPWRRQLEHDVHAGLVPESAVDAALARILLLASRVGALQSGGSSVRHWPGDVTAPDAPERRAALRRIASRGMVLLKNDGVLPLNAGDTVAAIGRPVVDTVTMGGGSSKVTRPYSVSLEQGLTAELGDRVAIVDGWDIRNHPTTSRGTILDPETGTPGFRLALHVGDEMVHSMLVTDPEAHFKWVIADPDRAHLADQGAVPIDEVVLEAVVGDDVPAGRMRVGGVGAGSWRIRAGEQEVHENLELLAADPGEAVIVPPRFEQGIQVTPGMRIRAVIGRPKRDMRKELLDDSRFGLTDIAHLLDTTTTGVAGLVLAPVRESRDEVIERAIEAAKRADVAIVAVGLTDEQETESRDKETLRLPQGQDALVEAVAKVAKKTVVIVNAGTPVLTPWRDEVDAILVVGLPGQEGGDAITDVLVGHAEPTGRLVTSWPTDDGASPAWNVTPDENLRVHYGEGSAIGYRGYAEGACEAPAFWFGEGLGFGTWDYRDLTVEDRDGCTLASVTIENTSERDAREVVQVYFEPDANKPVRLVGYRSVPVRAGESVRVDVPLESRVMRVWAGGEWRPLGSGRVIVARGLGDRRLVTRLEK